MISLAAQITAASRYAQREAAQRAAEARLKAERQAETRAKQWASRKAGGNGINDELLKRLPTVKEKAGIRNMWLIPSMPDQAEKFSFFGFSG